MLRVFIGFDSRFPEPARVLAWSIFKHTTVPVHVSYLDINHLKTVYGFDRVADPLASTEFTYSRFLVPYLCNYDGKAVFMDNDMLCCGDIAELDALDMTGLALRVVKHEHTASSHMKMYGAIQTNYPRKNWSSLMLMDCSKLRLWTKNAVERCSGAYLHRFQDIPDEAIGDLPTGWNVLLDVDKPCDDIGSVKLLHWTEGGPWYEKYAACAHSDLWYKARADMYADTLHGVYP